MKTSIKTVRARQIIDCKCRPMVEADVVTEGGAVGRGAAPTGTSVGIHEAYILRDGDPAEYNGLGVRKAVANITDKIAPALVGMDVMDQEGVDKRMLELDGTEDKSRLGGNAVYSVSIAVLRAAAAAMGREVYDYISGGRIKSVPVPSFNVINGGRYGSMKQAFNEFILMPYKAENIEEAVEIGVLVFAKLEEVIKKYTGKAAGVGRSYGWITPSEDPEVVLELMEEATDLCGYHGKTALALDCAISDFYSSDTGTYYLNGNNISTDELIDYAKTLTERHNLLFIEDLLHEDDWEGYKKARERIKKTLIIGDDFCVSNPERIRRAHEMGAIDGFILKPNQVGTITEALAAHDYAVKNNLLSITSGRSGGVVGDIVMDLAVGLHIGFIKNGAPRSGERIDKLNFLIRVNSLHPGCRMANISGLVRF